MLGRMRTPVQGANLQGNSLGHQLRRKAILPPFRRFYSLVLGHPDYYPRFGFTTARHYGIVWEHNIPEGAFMVQELKSGALGQIQGVVKYRPEFDAV